MKSLCLSALFAVCLAVSAEVAQAQCDGPCAYSTTMAGPGCGTYTACDYFRAGYIANRSWPSQFVPAARRGVCDAIAAMSNNGWRRQNLLGDYHFEQDTNKLTKAGEMKVNWILTQAPPQRRMVYVQRAASEEDTSTRIASVQNYGGTMSPTIASVNVMDTHIVAEGHRASTVDSIFVGYHENRPPPVLPAANSSAGNNVSSGN